MGTSRTVRSAAGAAGVNDTAYRARKETYFRKVRFLIAVGALPESVEADAEAMFALCGGFGWGAIQAQGKVNYIIETPVSELIEGFQNGELLP